MADKVIPLQGVRSNGEIHPPRFERVPPPPRRLRKRAKEVWRVAAKDLHDRAILTTLDTGILERYCNIVAEAEELEALLAQPRDVAPREVSDEQLARLARQMWKVARQHARALLLSRSGHDRPLGAKEP